MYCFFFFSRMLVSATAADPWSSTSRAAGPWWASPRPGSAAPSRSSRASTTRSARPRSGSLRWSARPSRKFLVEANAHHVDQLSTGPGSEAPSPKVTWTSTSSEVHFWNEVLDSNRLPAKKFPCRQKTPSKEKFDQAKIRPSLTVDQFKVSAKTQKNRLDSNNCDNCC